MRFRWKLLILLLVMSLLPVGGLRFLGTQTVQRLGERAFSQIHAYLIAEKKAQSQLLVDSISETLWCGMEHMETALLFQAREVERCLAREAAPSAMMPIYRQLAKRLNDRLLWQYTTLENGLHSAFPGYNGKSEPLEPKQQIWHRSMQQDGDISWSEPYMDEHTRQILMAVSTPVKRPDGTLAGKTAMVMLVDDLLNRKFILKSLPAETRFFIGRLTGDEAGGERRMRVLAQGEYAEIKRGSWRTHIEPEWLTSDDEIQFLAMIKDLEAGTGNIRRMRQNGCDCLWVYGSLFRGPDRQQSFVVLTTPYADILKPASEADDYVQGFMDDLVAMTRRGMWGIVLIVVLVSFFFARSVTKPIQALEEGARLLGSGRFDTRVDIRSRDEFGDMAKIFNSVVPRLEAYYHLRQSMALAMEVQQNLLPKSDPTVTGLDIAGKSLYCDETGGDYYDYIDTGAYQKGEIRVVVGDVSDHGIPSALLMTTARAILRQRSSMPGTIDQIISDVNRQLAGDIKDSGRYMSLFYCEINAMGGWVQWVRAGHDPAIVYNMETDHFDELKGRGVPLGVIEDYVYEQFQRDFSRGQVILIGTDGIWESQNPKGEMFGKEAVKKILRDQAGKPARDIIDSIIDALAAFRKPNDQHDDVTIVVIKAAGNP